MILCAFSIVIMTVELLIEDSLIAFAKPCRSGRPTHCAELGLRAEVSLRCIPPALLNFILRCTAVRTSGKAFAKACDRETEKSPPQKAAAATQAPPVDSGQSSRSKAARDLAVLNLEIDSKLRGCDVVAIRFDDVAAGGYTADRATVRQKKTGRPVRFELSEKPARSSMII
jgi:hypothetical protein